MSWPGNWNPSIYWEVNPGHEALTARVCSPSSAVPTSPTLALHCPASCRNSHDSTTVYQRSQHTTPLERLKDGKVFLESGDCGKYDYKCHHIKRIWKHTVKQPAGKATPGADLSRPACRCVKIAATCELADRRDREKDHSPTDGASRSTKSTDPRNTAQPRAGGNPPSPRQESRTEPWRRTPHRRGGARPGTRRVVAVPTRLQQEPHALTESSGSPAGVPTPQKWDAASENRDRPRGGQPRSRCPSPRSLPGGSSRKGVSRRGRPPKPTPASEARVEGRERAGSARCVGTSSKRMCVREGRGGGGSGHLGVGQRSALRRLRQPFCFPHTQPPPPRAVAAAVAVSR